MKEFCRTCLQEIRNPSPDNQSWENIKFEILFCIPEIEIDLVSTPSLCLSCLNALHLCYSFKNLCLVNEQRLYLSMQDLHISSNSHTLAEVLYKIETAVNKTNTSSPANVFMQEIDIPVGVPEQQPATENVNCVHEEMTEKPVINTNQHVHEITKEPIINTVQHVQESTDEPVINTDQHVQESTGESVINTNQHDDVISNLEPLANDTSQLVELFEEPQVSGTCFNMNELEVQADPVLELSVSNNPIESTPKPIKFNLLQKQKVKYRCELCDYSSGINEDLLLHKRRSHSDSVFKCVLCNINFISKFVLTKHMSVDHNIHKLFSCTSCNYTCHVEQYLISHMSDHFKGSTLESADIVMVD